MNSKTSIILTSALQTLAWRDSLRNLTLSECSFNKTTKVRELIKNLLIFMFSSTGLQLSTGVFLRETNHLLSMTLQPGRRDINGTHERMCLWESDQEVYRVLHHELLLFRKHGEESFTVWLQCVRGVATSVTPCNCFRLTVKCRFSDIWWLFTGKVQRALFHLC